ncbi:type II secretion system F family protein [Gemmatimonas sp.]|uniref:type II secretion system F family protein n=1 Tax=Gemmatimonas sp. TaxID=1962908 RepID=UPI0037BEFDF4
MTWRYRAADASGRESRGTVQAASADDARAQLRARALWAIEIIPERSLDRLPDLSVERSSPPRAFATAPRTSMPALHPMRAGLAQLWGRWSGEESEALAVCMRSIATLLDAGVPVDRALAFAASGGPEHDATAPAASWRVVFGRLQQAVRDGRSLADAMRDERALPVAFAPSVAAAEATGALPETFARLASALERAAATQARVRAALVYPAVLALSSVIGTLVILLVVVPRFAELMNDGGAPLPMTTRLLVAASTGLLQGGWLAGPLGVGALVWWRRALRDPARATAWDAQRLGWPLIGRFERDRDGARYLDTLSLALASGVSLLRAMALARATMQNRALAARLEPAEARVRDGVPLVDAVGDTLPPLARQLLRAGEAGGALSGLAARAAAAADGEAERQLGRVVALIEPVMILGFGGVVALVALALLQAIYGLNASPL